MADANFYDKTKTSLFAEAWDNAKKDTDKLFANTKLYWVGLAMAWIPSIYLIYTTLDMYYISPRVAELSISDHITGIGLPSILVLALLMTLKGLFREIRRLFS